MHTDKLSPWQHHHVFGDDSGQAERSTRLVMWITLATMVIEIGAGAWFNSMALLADGWHMSSHALAIGLSAGAYAAARRSAASPIGVTAGRRHRSRAAQWAHRAGTVGGGATLPSRSASTARRS